MSAVLYCRVSSLEQAKENQSLPVQEARLRDYCSRNNLTVLRAFGDKQSAWTAEKRPAFENMMQFCKSSRGKVTHVLVCDLSRLARNVLDQALSIAALQQCGIKLISIDEQIVNDTPTGKLAANVLSSFNQFFSDSLSERTRFRMQAAMQDGRFLSRAPIGYKNHDGGIIVDSERAPLIKEAFRLMASGSFTGDAVLKRVTALGLTTQKGRPITKQSFAHMLQNPVYAGWIRNGGNHLRGNHEALITDELFQAVQDVLNGKSRPHARVSEDFPLRGFVRCASCNKNLTAGHAQGRKHTYARYWCWTKGCGAVGVSKDALEGQFVSLLSRMEPTVALLEQLPKIASRQWAERKARIAASSKNLNNRLAEQQALNQKGLTAFVNGRLSQEDFDSLKASIATETARIEAEITALDSERSTIEDLTQQARMQLVSLSAAWRDGNANQRQELARSLFPDGLVFSAERLFFEPANHEIFDMFKRFLRSQKEIGVGGGI